MASLQSQSIKIKKNRKSTNVKDHNYFCGCGCTYRSYPALYLHIKRKHNGIKPVNTRILRLNTSEGRIHTGRPQKPPQDVDDISAEQLYLEQIQSDFLGFLGESLKIVSTMDTKPELEAVVAEIMNICDEENNEALAQMKKQTEDLFQELKQDNNTIVKKELDFDGFSALEKNKPLKILCWFLLWLGKYIVKIQSLKDLTYIFSKVWIVLTKKGLEIQDLDNKIVWNGVLKECESSLSTLIYFEGKKELIYEFVSKMCHLIGKTFE